jgi:hypothetical protein
MNTIGNLACFSFLIVILVLIIIIFIKINTYTQEEYRHNINKRPKPVKMVHQSDPCKSNERLITNYQASCEQGFVDGEHFRTKCFGKEKVLHLKECINFEKKDWNNWTILNTNIGLCGDTLQCETKSYP